METHKNYYTARTYSSHCLRVENEMHINLKEQYQNDKVYNMMQRIKYLHKESSEQKQSQSGIVF